MIWSNYMSWVGHVPCHGRASHAPNAIERIVNRCSRFSTLSTFCLRQHLKHDRCHLNSFRIYFIVAAGAAAAAAATIAIIAGTVALTAQAYTLSIWTLQLPLLCVTRREIPSCLSVVHFVHFCNAFRLISANCRRPDWSIGRPQTNKSISDEFEVWTIKWIIQFNCGFCKQIDEFVHGIAWPSAHESRSGIVNVVKTTNTDDERFIFTLSVCLRFKMAESQSSVVCELHWCIVLCLCAVRTLIVSAHQWVTVRFFIQHFVFEEMV